MSVRDTAAAGSVMFAHQATLPLLPVPSLAETGAKYLSTVRPFLSDADFERTRNLTAHFITNGEGQKLHERLLARAEMAKSLSADYQLPFSRMRSEISTETGSHSDRHPSSLTTYKSYTDLSIARQNQLVKTINKVLPTKNNWLIDWWNEYSYLRYREALVLNVSFFFVFNDDPHRRDMLDRAAALLDASLKFKKMVVDETLMPDMARDMPMCMQQYRFLFNSCRVPQTPSDRVRVYDSRKHHHVVVMRQNRIFSFDLMVQSNNGDPREKLSVGAIRSQLAKICERTSNTPKEGSSDAPCVGILTATHRDIWALNYADLTTAGSDEIMQHNTNVLETIQSADLVLCLDDSTPMTREEIAHACWHGYGRNRWFDKTLQLIVFRNGRAGFLGEHSMVDATTPARYCDFICETSNKMNEIGNSSEGNGLVLEPPRELKLQLSPHLLSQLPVYCNELVSQVDAHELSVLHYCVHGKDFPKSLGMSPDSYIQMAIQLAYYKLMGTFAATYESAGMKRFAWGRTETCRSVSLESAAFVKAMEETALNSHQKAELCRAAVRAHSQYMSDCVQGKGIDRHLLGLRLSLEDDEPLPSFFVDFAYNLSCHWTLSTSQIPSNEFDGYGWGEVVPDGFGVAYMTREDRLIFNIAGLVGDKVPDISCDEASNSWFVKNYKRQRVKWFRSCLEKALDEMHEVLSSNSSKHGVTKPVKNTTVAAPEQAAENKTERLPEKSPESTLPSPTSVTSKTQLGFTLAYPARTAAEDVYVLDDNIRSGVVGEDLGRIEFEWAEQRTRHPSVFSSPKKWQSVTSLHSRTSSTQRGRKILRILKDWVPGIDYVPSLSVEPSGQRDKDDSAK